MKYKDDLQKYYVGFYGRPADLEGLEYWNSVLENLDVDEGAGFGDRFVLVKEYFAGEGGETSEYDMITEGLDNDELVDMIYMNLFGRGADEDDGRDFWVEALDTEKSTPITVVHDIIDGIKDDSDDAAVFSNRLEAANYFTSHLGDSRYQRKDISDVRELLDVVNETAESVDASKAAIDDWIDAQPPIPDLETFIMPIGEGAVVVGADETEADIFSFDIGAAQALSDLTQPVVAGFDTAIHSLELKLPDDVDVDEGALGDLEALMDAVDGWKTDYSVFNEELIAQFGPKDDDDLITLTLQGVQDAEGVAVMIA